MNLEELESIISKNMTITDERLYEAVMSTALDVEKAAQAAERERIKEIVAECLWIGQEMTSFEEWADNNNLSEYGKACSIGAWKAAQAAERERIKQIVTEVAWQGNHDKWFDCADAIADRIEDVKQ